MAKNYFILDGISSQEYGIWLREAITVSGAEPVMVESVSVPGRNGDLHIPGRSFQNRTITARCFVAGERAQQSLTAISQWVLHSADYQRLEFSWEPGIYWMARVKTGPDISAESGRLRQFSLVFDCKPQRFLKSGEQPILLTAPAALCNSGMEALPLITVYGSGPGTLTVGGVTVTLHALDGQLCLDCDTQNAYQGTANKNSTIYAPEFPRLRPGRNEISWTGGVERLEIIPRWWTI